MPRSKYLVKMIRRRVVTITVKIYQRDDDDSEGKCDRYCDVVGVGRINCSSFCVQRVFVRSVPLHLYP